LVFEKMFCRGKYEKMRGIEWNRFSLLIFLQSILYGMGDPISKVAYAAMPVYSLLSIRYLIALILFMAFAGKRVLRGLKQCSVKDWLIPGLCIAGGNVLNNVALQLTAATSVAFLRSLSIVLTPVLALTLFRNRFAWQHIPVQVMIIIGSYLLCGLGGLSSFGLGEVIALLSALMMAGALVFGGRALEKVDAITLSTAQTAISALAAICCMLFFGTKLDLTVATFEIWGIIVYLAVLCTFGGYLFQNIALRKLTDRSVALLQCVCPVMTAFFSYIILRERLSVVGMVGAIIILVCVMIETLMGEKWDREKVKTNSF